MPRHKKPPKVKYRTCRSPITYRKLRDGKYEFLVRAVGPGGTAVTAAHETFRIA